MGRLLVVAGLLAAAGPSAAGPDLAGRGTLRVLVNPDPRRPEFFSLRPDRPPGFDQEVLQGLARPHRLRRALDEYIENLRRTPTWSRLTVKYFGDAAPEILRKVKQ